MYNTDKSMLFKPHANIELGEESKGFSSCLLLVSRKQINAAGIRTHTSCWREAVAADEAGWRASQVRQLLRHQVTVSDVPLLLRLSALQFAASLFKRPKAAASNLREAKCLTPHWGPKLKAAGRTQTKIRKELKGANVKIHKSSNSRQWTSRRKET